MREGNSALTFAFGKDSNWSLVLNPWSSVLGPWSLVRAGFFLLVLGLRFEIVAAQSSPDLTPYLGQPIAQVVILSGGAPLTGDDLALADLIGIREGEPLRLPAVREAIVRLYRSGQAANVVVTAQGPPTALTLQFDITPQPRVHEVVLEGVEATIRDEVRRRLPPLEPGTRITPGQLNRAAEQIVEYYHNLGYFDVQATSDLSLDAGGREATVIFRVTPGERSTVDAIQFEGTLKLDPPEALTTFRLKQGAPYDAFMLQEDVQQLRRLHLERGFRAPRIGTPRITRDPERNTVTVLIPVDSGPLVEIQTEGIKLSEKRQQTIFPTLEVGGIDPATLEEGRLKLLDYLQRQGHFFAEVEVDPPPPSEDRVVIVYRVETGRKYDLNEIRIQGADALTYEDVKTELGSQVGGFFGRGLTSRELMEVDRRVIVDFLRARGYLNARVDESRLSIALNREDLIIIYLVEPGEQSQIAEITFKGNEAVAQEELQQQLRLMTGQPLSQTLVSEEAARLTAFYSARGYAEATVDAQIEFIREGAPEVRVVFNIREGSQLSIHRVLVRGSVITRESGLRKFLTFREGEWLVNERLSESEQNLYATSAFRRVEISKESAGVSLGELNQRNVVVQLVEAPRFLLSYGGGYRTDDGPRGLFEITNTNLLGRLYTGSFRVRASRREQLGQLSFTNPRPWGHKWPVLFSTFFQREERDAFDASRLTGLIQVERELPGDSFLILRYSFSNVVISNVTEPERLRREETTAKIGRISASLLRDRRNSALDPTQGNYTSFDFSVAGGALGGNENFIRLFGEHQRYYSVPGLPATVFAMNLRLGLVKPYGATDTVVISERFFAGGSTTLRGFSFEEAGPRGLDPNNPGQTKPLGGDALAIFNAELRFPIWKRLGLGGALFYDGGNVFLPYSEIKAEAIPETRRNFTHTLGFGFRIKTPIGPVRLDFGVLAQREPLVPRTRLHISFGPPF